jgi:hypothetical protein
VQPVSRLHVQRSHHAKTVTAALSFVIVSRHGGVHAKYRGMLVRREGEPGPILLCMGLFSRFCVWTLRCTAEEYLHGVRDTKSSALRANGYSIRLQPIPLQLAFAGIRVRDKWRADHADRRLVADVDDLLVG